MLKALAGLFRWFWHVVDESRRAVVNILFLFLMLMLFAAALGGGQPLVPGSAALVLDPEGFIVEQHTGEPVDRALDRAAGRGRPETLLRDVLRAIERAADDGRITALVLDLDAMGPTGLSKVQEIGLAIERFRESGKPVIAVGDFYGQSSYYLASLADEVYLHPEGAVFIDGYGMYRNYYREALETLRVDWNVFRVGEYKTAVEPFLRDDMSPEAREANAALLADLWSIYTADVEARRELDAGTLQDYADRFPERLDAAGGDLAQTALDAGLVDGLLHYDEIEDHLGELIGGASLERVHLASYLAEADAAGMLGGSGDAVAVIIAQGPILPGDQPPGAVGADSLRELLRRAADDDDVGAVVLRVDSPGGSHFASDVIRRDLDRLREQGKPVVVSMSSVAASGGYWIAMGGDEVLARPSTITGSIGIYSMYPTFQGSLDWLGVHTDGVGTTALAGAFRSDRELTPELSAVLQRITESGYEEFIQLVSERRGLSVEAVDALARGRVWSGAEAAELALVDRLGGLRDAIDVAAERGGLSDPRVTYIETELTPRERFLIDLLEAGVDLGLGGGRPPPQLALLESLLQPMLPDLALFATSADPLHRYAYCFCDGI